MRLFKLSIKLGPFTWSRTKVKPLGQAVVASYTRGSVPPPMPGWYWTFGQYRYWTGSEWL